MRLTLDEILTIQKWFSGFKDKASFLPIKAQWNLARNMKQLESISDEFDDFRSSLANKFRDEFFSDEKSEETEESKKDENGNEIISNDGKPVTQKVRKVKPQYMSEFKSKLDEVNIQLAKIGAQMHEITVYPLNIDNFIDKIPEDANFTFEDLEMLATFQKVSYD